MTFPQTALPITTELYLNGAWTDITTDVYSRDPIRITRGRADEGRQVDAGRCQLTLDNRAGKYSPRNPLSPYYGQLGRNTPIRVSVAAGASYLSVPGGISPACGATTPDTASLDITGDIDVRFDATLRNWVTFSPTTLATAVDLCGKYVTATSQRAWFLQQRNGSWHFEWSPNGTTAIEVNGTVIPTVPSSGRLAWRVTLDVDNGLGGYTVTFYTAPTIAGPWTQQEQIVTNSGTTSIFNSTAPLIVGDGSDIISTNPSGGINAVQIRNGINGTVVANPDFTAQTPGVSSFADSTGKTWSILSNSQISNRKTRFAGEVPAWPVKADTSGKDVYVQIEAAGILRRLGQGASPIQSAMRREFGNPARTNIVAYWPCEDGAGATSFASAHSGEAALAVSGAVTPASYTGWAASDALPVFNAAPSMVRGTVPLYTATDYAFLRAFVYIPSAVSGTVRLFSFTTTGTARTWSVYLDSTGGLALKAFDPDGTTILDTGSIVFNINGLKRQLGVELTRNGTGIDWRIICFQVEDIVTLPQLSGTLASRTIGSVTQVRMGEDGGLDNVAFGHIAVANSSTAYAATAGAMVGWAGESAPDRITRLCGEETVPVYVAGVGGEKLGAQHSTALVGLLQEAAATDHGILYEDRESVALAYRNLTSLYNQGVTATLNYSAKGQVQSPLDPIDDDQNVRNDVTVTRVGGSWGRYTQTTGSMSVNAPPSGVGRYPDSPSLSLYSDDQPVQHAGWLTHLGTVDEARYPVVNVALHAAPSLIDSVTTLDTGARLQITNLSSRYPPGTVDQLVQGYTEILSQFLWILAFNCTPASPYTVGVLDDPVLGRADTDGSQLAAGMTSTATSMSVAVTAGPLWTTDPADRPFDVTVGGEQMTVTNITGTSSPQTFTVTRSVNGVVKAQTTGTDVRLFQPTIVGL